MEAVRVFRPETEHPCRYMPLTAAEVEQFAKQKLEQAPSVVAGHAGTVVWYTAGEVRGYIVQVKFARGDDAFFLLPCSFEPVFGLDKFDGMLIQDAEAFALMNRLGWKSDRLDVFAGKDTVDTRTYLQARGVNTAVDGATAARAQAAFAEAGGIIGPLLSRDVQVASGPEKVRLRRALELLAEALRVSPGNGAALWFCGKACVMLEEPERALDLLTRAAQAEPGQSQFAKDAALVAIRLGRAEAAVGMGRQALAAAPGSPELRSNYALALLIAGEARGGAAECAEALKTPHDSQQITRRVLAACQAVAAGKVRAPRNEAQVVQILTALGRS